MTSLSILHKQFKYTTSANTDISKRFDRERKRLAAEKKLAEANTKEAAQKVRAMPRVKSA